VQDTILLVGAELREAELIQLLGLRLEAVDQ
jgi:hypothetical protein